MPIPLKTILGNHILRKPSVKIYRAVLTLLLSVPLSIDTPRKVHSLAVGLQ